MAEFYRSPHAIWWIIIPAGLALTIVAWLNPLSLNTPFLPLIGPFASWLGLNHNGLVALISVGAIAAHIGEAFYAFSLTKKLNLSFTTSLKWTVQTFILGFPSLRMLVKECSKRKR